ncbi:MAG: hypothetical protein LBU79_03850 [Planctomycetota bacterium]|jgi:hypothetical protein|nr:hypothetical protein [Planctomycetota bacterium]
MPDSSINNESREDVLLSPNLFEYFCQRTAEDFQERAKEEDPPTTSMASLLVSFMSAIAFYLFGRPQLAKVTFVISGILMLWMIWSLVIRSNSKLGEKADLIRNGSFPPDSAPYVLARLNWWNHLVVPNRWVKHSRIFDRQAKLERKLAEATKAIDEFLSKDPTLLSSYSPPSQEEAAALEASINNYGDRHEYEKQLETMPASLAKLRGELALYLALTIKLQEMMGKLERIDKLTVVFQNFSASDLSHVVGEALQTLEERRILVLEVDRIDTDSFIDLVTVRVS